MRLHYKEGAIERLHKRILFRMAMLGYDLNRAYEGPTVTEALFHTHKRGVRGIGCYDKDSGRFTVQAGSHIALDSKVLKNATVTKARETLFGSAKGIAVLERDVQFESPSAAAVFVLGGSQNGWAEWVDEAGRTLDQVYRNNGEDLVVAE